MSPGERKRRIAAAWSTYHDRARELRERPLPELWRTFGEVLLWTELEDELARIWNS